MLPRATSLQADQLWWLAGCNLPVAAAHLYRDLVARMTSCLLATVRCLARQKAVQVGLRSKD